MQPESLADLDDLRSHIRHFVDDDALDGVGFLRLVKILRAYPLEERKVAYGYLVSEITTATRDDHGLRARTLGRIADLVGGEPPEVANDVAPLLRATA